VFVIEGLAVVESNPYLIPGRLKDTHLIGLEHICYRVRAKAQLPDIRLYERHSYASVGAAAGLGLPIIRSLLGHMDASTTQRYAHLQQDPVKAAAELISTKIDKAMKMKPKKLKAVK
jgi:integrase